MAKIPRTSDSTDSRGLFQRLFSSFRAGFMFGGKRNLYEIYGYSREVRPEEMVSKYERQDITSRIVDTPPEETWSFPPKILSKNEEFTAAWTKIVNLRARQIFDLWPTLMQADKLCAFGQFSVIWIGLPGDPASPAGKKYKPEDIAYAHVYGASNASIDKWVIDPANPRYGLPETYSLTMAGNNLAKRVHYSRCIHIVDRPLQGKSLAIPRLLQVYNLLDDLLKIGGGSAETFWLTANRGMQIDVDKDMQLDTNDAEDLSAEIEEFQHQLRRYIRTRGVKITTLGSDVADPTGVFRVLIALLSTATGIPQRILMGAEAGQLASEQDRANWSDYITRRRTTFAEPFVFQPLFQRFTALGLLPQLDEPVTFEWPSAFHQSPLEAAQTQAQFARSVVNLSRQVKEGTPVVTLEEARRSLNLPSEPANGELLPEPVTPPPPKNAGTGTTASGAVPGAKTNSGLPNGSFERTVIGPSGRPFTIKESYNVN